jgi:NAD(P)-dependent dehydrogenase (short-subunit alcohol dehydrogenase family)
MGVSWLEGKTALITGGASGIGRAVAERFLVEGARVCVLDVSEERLDALANVYGERIETVVGNVRCYQDNERAVAKTVESFGKLDTLVVNAGIFDGFTNICDLSLEVMQEAFHEIFSVNVLGCLYSVKAALTALKESRGTIIFTLSQASFYPDGGGPLYTASKHAALGLMRQLAFELAPDIRVNGVAPGGTITALRVPSSLHARMPPLDEAQRRRRIAARNPLHIAMDPEDHAAVYVLLASDQSRAITGEVIRSDGGLGVRGMWGGGKEGMT